MLLHHLPTKLAYKKLLILLTFFCVCAMNVQAQLTCNVAERMNPPTHTSMSEDHSPEVVVVVYLHGVRDASNVISASTTDFAIMRSILGTPEFLSVKDGSVGTGGYAAGHFAGFEIETSGLLSLSLLGNISISVLSGGSVVETKSVDASLLSASLLTTGGRGTVGFVTSVAFDEVRINTSSVLALGDIKVYNAVIEKYCAGPALDCNTPTTLTSPSFPLSVDMAHTGISGVACILCSISNPENAIDASLSNFATIDLTLSVGVTGSIAIKDNVTKHPAGTFAGFDISSSSLLSAGVLSNLSVKTYKNGVATGDVASGASLLSSGSSILSGGGRKIYGFFATQEFDEIELVAENLVGLSLGTINVYGAVFEKFCKAPLPACNVMTPYANPAYPVYVDGQNSGVDGLVCTLCSINNSQNAVDANPSNFVSIVLPVGVATTANFAVANAVDTMPVNSFAGFDLETNSLVSASVISSATIQLYHNGSLVQTGSGNALIVGATTSLLSTTSRQLVGIIANVEYDEVKISFSQLVGADLGTIKIYSAVFQKSCMPTIICNHSYYLNAPDFPAVINIERTGIFGAVSALGTISDPWNVVSASKTDFARISNTAAVAAVASISVLDPVSTYPAGTFAGYVIQTAAVPPVLLNLFNAITVTTYLNGSLQESKTGGSLIDLTVLATLIGTPGGASYNVGFETTAPFDEIRISVSSLVGVGLLGGDYVDVYGAFIDTRTSSSATLACQQTYPDINATFLGVLAVGNVSTNDIARTGTTYGTPIASSGNPATTLPVLNSDGTYTFMPTVVGVYEFSVPVCFPGGIVPCPKEMLTITVLDNTVGYKNPPVANTDIAMANFNSPVIVTALVNDAIGTPGSRLDTGSISIVDLNGAAAGNSKNGGTAVASTITGLITYTPATGFSGSDTVLYTICDNQTPTAMCASASIVITVLPSGVVNMTSAADDYDQTPQGAPMTGQVLTNDIDPEGHGQTVTPKTYTAPGGAYTFSVNALGEFTFTPDASFTGPASMTYQVSDNQVPPASANATIYMLVSPLSFPLPLKLVSFEGQTSNCNSILSWKSGSELNLNYYRLEYSTDAKTWVELKKIAGKGNGSSYQAEHQATNGKAYYRIVMVEINGAKSQSNVINLNNDCSNGTMRVYPNPASDELTIDLTGVNTETIYSILDIMGKPVLSGSLELNSKNNINLRQMAQGLYILETVSNGSKTIHSFQVIR